MSQGHPVNLTLFFLMGKFISKQKRYDIFYNIFHNIGW